MNLLLTDPNSVANEFPSMPFPIASNVEKARKSCFIHNSNALGCDQERKGGAWRKWTGKRFKKLITDRTLLA
jgi:hypothetical protein